MSTIKEVLSSPDRIHSYLENETIFAVMQRREQWVVAAILFLGLLFLWVSIGLLNTPSERRVVSLGDGVQVNVASHQFFGGFWNSITTWEPNTFSTFGRYLDNKTVYIGFGEWIGPTILYAAAYVPMAIGFEPDPRAFKY